MSDALARIFAKLRNTRASYQRTHERHPVRRVESEQRPTTSPAQNVPDVVTEMRRGKR